MVKEIKNKEELKEIVKTGLVVVDFFAEWCGPCKMLAPQLHTVADSMNDVTFVKVNVDECSELAQDYEVSSLPTLVIVKNGKVIDRNIGFADSEFITNWINGHK